MFSSLGMADASPRVAYPDIPEMSMQEKLLMERDATGMYFSGQMLDEYSRHVALLRPRSLTDLLSEEAELTDKQRVSVVGIVGAVSLKTTRNGDRMAFFTIKDRFGELECVAFSRVFAENSYLIRTDGAVWVSGSISLREDEPPKILGIAN